MEENTPLQRREFLKLMAASLSLAGLSACRPQPVERILPYTLPPEELVAGEALFFATAMEMDGFGYGLLVRSHMGRPVKVEGNPDHPASLGATNTFAQASILDLYDPDRAKNISIHGDPQLRSSFLSALQTNLQTQQERQGAGLYLLTGPVSSPTLTAQIEELLELFPQAQWRQYYPVDRTNIYAGAELAFGEPAQPLYRFDQAEVILSLDCDFLYTEPFSVRYLTDFASRRRPRQDQAEMNRLYVVESGFSTTGVSADHRLALSLPEVGAFARQLAGSLGAAGLNTSAVQFSENFLAALVEDLQAHPGASLILAGPRQPPEIHALAHAMNEALGNVGSTVIYTDPILVNPENPHQSLAGLVADLNAGQVEMLVILGGNPVYTAPVDLNFAEAVQQAGTSIYLGTHPDETAALVDWLVPSTHYMEMWSDTRAYDGTVSLVQPLIEPLYDAFSPHELLSALQGQPQRTGYSILRQYWQEQSGLPENEGQAFETFWRESLSRGVIEGTAAEARQLSLQPGLAAELTDRINLITAQNAGLHLLFEPDPSTWDGRFANNAWLQELPRPITKLVWDNAALLGPQTARQLGVVSEDVVELRYRGRTLTAAVLIVPGQVEGTLILPLGYGRTLGGEAQAARVAEGAGFNAYFLRTSDAPWFDVGLEALPTGERYRLAFTQEQMSMEGREPVRRGTLAQFQTEPEFIQPGEGLLPSLYPEYEYDLHAWGMSIDLTACTGCNACVIACQAENNVPVVGKEEVLNRREMHWLRIDTYIEGPHDHPNVYFQPLLCMHCEKAPCEPVCPVKATVHSSEGLNDQVYARCIGVRYCSHNCPYKVRRFNYYQYANDDLIPLKMLQNPDVTVRSRGVIEKCTFCVQRINAARSKAKIENRRIREGELVTACQQVCPARAIVFGDLNNPDSQVLALKQEPHNYGLLAELGTQPRLTYLARLQNPNPNLPLAENREVADA